MAELTANMTLYITNGKSANAIAELIQLVEECKADETADYRKLLSMSILLDTIVDGIKYLPNYIDGSMSLEDYWNGDKQGTTWVTRGGQSGSHSSSEDCSGKSVDEVQGQAGS